MNRQELTTAYMALVIVTGVVCLAVALALFPFEKIDFTLVLLAAFTIGVGSRITVPIPRLKSRISVSDTFIFLVLLIYGGEAAVVLSAVEAFCSSWRFCSKKITIVFNACAMAISTTAAVSMLKVFGLYTESQLHGYDTKVTDFLIALSIMAVTQFLSNTVIASLQDSIKHNDSWLETWKSKYIWTFLTYFLGAASAGLLVQLSDTIGVGIIVATFPVILFVFLTYKMYLQNIEMSIRQAEQAERYAEVLKAQSDALRESEERFRSAFHHAPIGIALLSASGKWMKVNRALCRILGYSEAEFLSADLDLVLFPEDRGATVVKLREVVSGNATSWQEEQRYRHKTGRVVWASWSVSLASHAAADTSNLILQLQDITGKKLAEEKLQHKATHDSLTGLPNRALFMGKLSDALANIRKNAESRVSVLFVDVDRFKNVNDSLGHVIGDQLLVKISERLTECLRPSDIVARLGGDEFMILVEGKYEVRETVAIAERIQHKFSLPFMLDGNEIYSSASIGILHASEKHLTSEDMMRDADTAMYQAKRGGKARHEIFDEKMRDAVIETLQLETDLRRAVEREEFSVDYQPIFSLVTGQLEGVHALPRWDHPRLGAVPRRKFIDLAQEIGIIGQFGSLFLRKACREIVQFQRQADIEPPLILCVNLLSSQLMQDGLLERIKGILTDTNFTPRDLSLEITESIFFDHQEKAAVLLDQIGQLGVDLKIGNFGTGYSNLSYLTQLPVSSLKIDRSFVSTIGDGLAKCDLVRAVATLARNLGLKVVAEGVTSSGQLEELRNLSCDSAQGSYFSEPMDIDHLRKFIDENENRKFPPPGFTDVTVLPVIQ
jgi:diguanylate cyclase (GGDEF)-like protein/PAS domain S-box-containing protein